MIAAPIVLFLSSIAAAGDAPEPAMATSPASAPVAATTTTTSRILVLDLKATDVAPGEAALMKERITLRLSKVRGIQAVSQDDMKQLIDLEASKLTAGCDLNENNSCLAEVAGALGAQYIVTGKVGRIGDRFVVNLTLLDGAKAESRARSSAEAGSTSDLLARIDAAVDELVLPLAGATSAGGSTPLLWTGASVAGLGGVALVVGGVWSGALESTLANNSGSATSKKDALDQRGPALGTLAAGVLLTATGGTLLAFSMME